MDALTQCLDKTGFFSFSFLFFPLFLTFFLFIVPSTHFINRLCICSPKDVHSHTVLPECTLYTFSRSFCSLTTLRQRLTQKARRATKRRSKACTLNDGEVSFVHNNNIKTNTILNPSIIYPPFSLFPRF